MYFVQKNSTNSMKAIFFKLQRFFPGVLSSGVVARGRGPGPPSEKFLGALKSKGSAKIGNCQCEIPYKICKVQLVNRFKVIVILAFL